MVQSALIAPTAKTRKQSTTGLHAHRVSGLHPHFSCRARTKKNGVEKNRDVVQRNGPKKESKRERPAISRWKRSCRLGLVRSLAGTLSTNVIYGDGLPDAMVTDLYQGTGFSYPLRSLYIWRPTAQAKRRCRYFENILPRRTDVQRPCKTKRTVNMSIRSGVNHDIVCKYRAPSSSVCTVVDALATSRRTMIDSTPD